METEAGSGRETIEYVDCEPDWLDVISWYCDCLEYNYGTKETAQLARKEIMRCAKVMSDLRAKQKAGGEEE
tara:strand:- start:309 stop:521 length:213 start_codon:yes stop_codon:yes gene_type:complete